MRVYTLDGLGNHRLSVQHTFVHVVIRTIDISRTRYLPFLVSTIRVRIVLLPNNIPVQYFNILERRRMAPF